MNANPSENSCLTVETSKANSSELSSEISRKFEGRQSSLNSQILDVINTAIQTRVLPSIKNAFGTQILPKNANLNLRSDGLLPKTTSKPIQNTQNEFPRLVSVESNQINHCRENSEDSQRNDDEYGYDMVTGANLTPPLVPEFLNGRPMQYRNKNPHQQCINDDTLDTTLPAQQIPVHTNTRSTYSEIPLDPINRLADVIIDMDN